jgi:hypothetical protein
LLQFAARMNSITSLYKNPGVQSAVRRLVRLTPYSPPLSLKADELIRVSFVLSRLEDSRIPIPL